MEIIVGADTIPTWLVSVVLILTGVIWFLIKNRTVRMDSRIFAVTFILWGTAGLLFSRFPNVLPGVKVFYFKLMTVMLCLSQYIPLLVSLWRSIKRDERK
jgi:hypothetical protein